MDATVRIGTSGWSYPHWKGRFYPADLPAAKFLDFYTERFDTVEVNGTFYRLPGIEAVRSWQRQAPPGFLFAVKASRYLTHMKKLADPEEPLSIFFERIGLLGDKLGPILFQLPPRWRFDGDRLEAFLACLPGNFRYAFEFRDESWFVPRAYSLLERHGAALCLYDLGGHLSPMEITADFVYVRLHGPEGPYRGQYDDRTLDDWARRLVAWRDGGQCVYCYFDNDEAGYAPRDAMRLRPKLAGGGIS